MRPMTMESMLKPGSRVRWKRTGIGGTILALPGGHSGPADLLAALDDALELHVVHPTLLVATGESDGFAISRQMLIGKRQTLFAEMVNTLAMMRQTDLADPAARAALEAEVRRMSADWSSADATRARRKEVLVENPELRQRFVRL